MSEASPSQADGDAARAGRPFQFGFWTLVELVAGAAIASALYAEFGGLGLALALVGAIAGASALYVWYAPTLKSRSNRMAGLALACVGLCLWVCLLPSGGSSGASPRSQCTNNLKQIVLGLHNYHDTFGCFPPPYLVGPDGKPWHCWRVLVLPYIENQAAYNLYDFSEPWNGPKNSRLATISIPLLFCPTHANIAPGVTDYYYVVGGDRWPTGTDQVDLSQVESADGAAHTILLVESHTVGANWSQPRDLTVDEVLKGINQDFQNPSASAAHGNDGRRPRKGAGGIVVAMFDGSVRYLPATTDREGLNALLTIDGGEDMDTTNLVPSQPEPKRVAWWLPLIEAAFVVLIVYRHRPRRRTPAT